MKMLAGRKAGNPMLKERVGKGVGCGGLWPIFHLVIASGPNFGARPSSPNKWAVRVTERGWYYRCEKALWRGGGLDVASSVEHGRLVQILLPPWLHPLAHGAPGACSGQGDRAWRVPIAEHFPRSWGSCRMYRTIQEHNLFVDDGILQLQGNTEFKMLLAPSLTCFSRWKKVQALWRVILYFFCFLLAVFFFIISFLSFCFLFSLLFVNFSWH